MLDNEEALAPQGLLRHGEKIYKYVFFMEFRALDADELVRVWRFYAFGRGRPKFLQKSLSRCHIVHYPTRIALGSSPGLRSEKPNIGWVNTLLV